MSKTGKELIIVVILIGILALTVVDSLNKARQKKIAGQEKVETIENSEKKEKQEQVAESVTEPAESKDMEKQRERLGMEWGRDPFFAEEQEEKEKEKTEEGILKENGKIEFALKGISWEKNNPVALIEKQAVARGELVFGYEVVDIKKDRVILKKDGKEYELKLEK